MPQRPVVTEALGGKVVVLVHPAWHSCGSHRVFLSQAQAYMALGAQVVALAVHDTPGRPGGAQHRAYLAQTADLIADRRAWTAMAPSRLMDRRFLAALARRLRGDRALLRLAVAQRAPIPAAITALPRVDLVHCNHFFCMPVATRIAAVGGAPVILETHDMQARQYHLANAMGWTMPPAVSFDAMLAVERAAMQPADLLAHMNSEEDAAFRALMPAKRHALIYPAVAPMAVGQGGRDLVIVAAANHGNVQSVEWFLREVVPLAPNRPYRIIGTIADAIRVSAPRLFKQHAALFAERVEDMSSVYQAAAAILLPTVAGHGISIKTIEALSTGAPLVATPHAFRGMAIDPATLGNVRLADDAGAFAAGIEAVGAQPVSVGSTSDTRRLYDALFSPTAYREGLAALVTPLL